MIRRSTHVVAQAVSACALLMSSAASANVYTFQNNADYGGSRDLHIVKTTPDTNNGSDTGLFIQNNVGNEKHGLFKFNNSFTADPVASPAAIPLGWTINSATLSIRVSNEGGASRFAIHRMLLDFTEGNGAVGAVDTWANWDSSYTGTPPGVPGRNTLPGVQLDDLEAYSFADDVSLPGEAATVGNRIVFNVTSSVRTFAEGTLPSPFGWTIQGLFGATNTGFNSRNAGTNANPVNRPIYLVDAVPTIAWQSAAGGNWTDAAWLSSTGATDAPNVPGAAARLANPAGGIVNLDQPITVGSLTLDSPAGYSVSSAASHSLALDQGAVSTADAFIHVASGDHAVSTPLTLATNTSITVATPVGAAANSLSLSGPISGAGALTKFGPGTLILSGANTYAGDTTLRGGTTIISSPDHLGSPANKLIFRDGARLRLDAPITTSREIVIYAGGAIFDTNGFDATVGPVSIPDPLVGTTSIGGTLFKAGAGALTLPSIGGAGLFLGAGSGAVRLAPNGTEASTSRITSLTLDGDATPTVQFDLADNDLIIDYTGAANTPIDTIRQQLQSGHASAAWTGNGIISSTAAASSIIGIMLAESSDLLGIPNTNAATATWSGQTVDGTSLLLAPAYYGDLNANGQVDRDDYALMDRSVAMALPAKWLSGDFNYDNAVDAADYLLMDRAFAFQSGSLSPAFLAQRQSQFGDTYVTHLLASIPEPSCLLALLLVPLMHRSTPRHLRHTLRPRRDI